MSVMVSGWWNNLSHLEMLILTAGGCHIRWNGGTEVMESSVPLIKKELTFVFVVGLF